jgi:hypothetical protein
LYLTYFLKIFKQKFIKPMDVWELK